MHYVIQLLSHTALKYHHKNDFLREARQSDDHSVWFLH